MKCAMELIAIAAEAKIQRELAEQAKRMEIERNTLKWCEDTLSPYLEYWARRSDSFARGNWTAEFGTGHVMHFDKTMANDIIRPLKQNCTYANGDPSYAPTDQELSLDYIVQYCKQYCIEVKISEHRYYRWGWGSCVGFDLQFRISPDCLKT